MPSHMRLRKLPARHFVMIENGQATMPFIQSDTMKAIIGGRSLALDTLDKIKPVEQHQAGDSQALIIALRNLNDRLKIIMIQSGLGRTHIDERADCWLGHK